MANIKKNHTLKLTIQFLTCIIDSVYKKAGKSNAHPDLKDTRYSSCGSEDHFLYKTNLALTWKRGWRMVFTVLQYHSLFLILSDL